MRPMASCSSSSGAPGLRRNDDGHWRSDPIDEEEFVLLDSCRRPLCAEGSHPCPAGRKPVCDTSPSVDYDRWSNPDDPRSTSLPSKPPEASSSNININHYSGSSEEDLAEDAEDDIEDMVFNVNPDIPEELAASEEECEDANEEAQACVNVIGEDVAFLCPVCREIPNDLCSTACGHLFCYPCISERFSHSNSCPVCLRSGARKQLQKIFLTI